LILENREEAIEFSKQFKKEIVGKVKDVLICSMPKKKRMLGISTNRTKTDLINDLVGRTKRTN
jgi:hypothetical protein